MFAQRIGDDLNPTIQQIIDSVNGLLEKFLSLDESQRQSIVKWAAFAAAIGPAVLILGKVVGAVGKVSGALGTAFTAIGKFSAKVSMARKQPGKPSRAWRKQRNHGRKPKRIPSTAGARDCPSSV